ncbi:MAG: Omp28 family outer membrane lipoprotein [Muribaculaceae bacterium]|nr:Omp28 family outer membrane lipoprotein [Muribaculaceae bacterium]
MKIKHKYGWRGMAAMIAVLALTACDHVGDDERLIYVKPASVQRAVLIEDFTGQRCVNCPTATDVIKRLQDQYGETAVIAVGIHSGPFARSVKGSRYALGTDEGDEYYAAWKLDHQPVGMVNRLRVSDYNEWSTQVYNEIQRTSLVSIAVTTVTDETTRQLHVNTTMMALDGTVKGKLQLWLVEDSIQAFQYLADNTIDREYIHNHVFRRAINGTWGQDVDIAEGNSSTVTCQTTLDDEWNVDRLSVVAFVYNDAGVQQVTRRPLKEIINEE